MAVRRKEKLVDGKWVDASTPVSAADEAPKADIKADGSLRRAGPGRRSMMDYFTDEKRREPVTRSELLGMFEAIEHSRHENRWYRQAVRWLYGTLSYSLRLPFVHVDPMPGPQDLPLFMTRAHVRRTIKPMIDAVQTELDRKERVKREEEEAGRAGGDK